MNNSQPCTRVSRSVHEDDDVRLNNQAKRRRVDQVNREEAHRVNSEPLLVENSSCLCLSDQQGLVDVKPFCIANLKETSFSIVNSKKVLEEPDRQGLIDVRPICIASLDEPRKTVSNVSGKDESRSGSSRSAGNDRLTARTEEEKQGVTETRSLCTANPSHSNIKKVLIRRMTAAATFVLMRLRRTQTPKKTMVALYMG